MDIFVSIFNSSFNKHLLSIYYMPSTVLSTGDTVMNTTGKVPGQMKPAFSETDDVKEGWVLTRNKDIPA